MSVITLTTDWGRRDHYVAAFKGELISHFPDIRLIDITHDIEPFDTLQASFVLQNCFDKFPDNTIHFIGMSGGKTKSPSQGYLLVKCRNHYFIGYDNGIFFLTLGEEKKEIMKLDIPESTPVFTAFGQMIKIMGELMNGAPISSFGVAVEELLQVYHTQPTVDKGSMRGAVIYIDSFGNVILNITNDFFEKARNNRPFTIFLRNHGLNLSKVYSNYNEVPEGEPVVLFNQTGNMEIAINRNKAAGLLGLKLFDTIRIEFEG